MYALITGGSSSSGSRFDIASTPPCRGTALRSLKTSSVPSTSSSRRSLFDAVLNIEPVLTKGAANLLSHPGGPPRNLGRRFDEEYSDSSSLSPVRSPPQARRPAVLQKTVASRPGTCGSVLENGGRGSDNEQMLSPCALSETIMGRSTWGGRGHIIRHGLDDALDNWDEEISEMAKFRFDSSRVMQAKDRQRAVKWRLEQKRQLELCEQRWHTQAAQSQQIADINITADPASQQSLILAGSSELTPQLATAFQDDTDSAAYSSELTVPVPARTKILKTSVKSRMRRLKASAVGRKHVEEQRAEEAERERVDDVQEEEFLNDAEAILLKLHEKEARQVAIFGCTFNRLHVSDLIGAVADEVLNSASGRTCGRLITSLAKRAAAEGGDSPKGRKGSACLSRLVPTAMMTCAEGLVTDATLREREMIALLEAFVRHDGDHSGTLDQPELRFCLAELGLQGSNSVERARIRAIIWDIVELQICFRDFVDKVVPPARQALRELRKPKLELFFDEVNTHHAGEVSVEDVVHALRRHGTIASDGVRDDAIRIFACEAGRKPAERKHDMLNREAFVRFVSVFQECNDRAHLDQFYQIAKRFDMSDEEQELWKHDLVSFYDMFHEYDPCGGKFGSATGLLTAQQVGTVVRESGYMPKTSSGQQKTFAMIKENVSEEGTIAFPVFLQIMEMLRELDREWLRKVFQRYGWAGLGIMPLSKVYDALVAAGISPKTYDEKFEVVSLVEACDDDGSKSVSCDEFIALCQSIGTKLRCMLRERERQYVLSAGWSEQLFIELREAFQVFDEDMSEVLEWEELMKALDLLKGQFQQSTTNMSSMFIACGIDPSKDVQVTFMTFLRMLKMLDESENRRQQGANMGFSRDLTDKLYGAFQSLENENSREAVSTVSKSDMEQVLTDISRTLPKVQMMMGELSRSLKSEPMKVEFGGFLRIMRIIESNVESVDQLDAVVHEILQWKVVVVQEEKKESDDDRGNAEQLARAAALLKELRM